MSKNIQQSQAHHVLCDRLSMVENNENILTDAMMTALGPDKCHEVLQLAYRNGYNKHSDEFDRYEDGGGVTSEDYSRSMNTKLNSGPVSRTKIKKKVDMATQGDFDDY